MSDPVATYTQALRLYGSKQTEAALKLLKQIIQQTPGFDRAYGKLIAIHQEQKNLAVARAYFQSLAERTSQNSYSAYGLGLIAREEQQFDYSLERLKTCIRAAPDFAPAYTALADVAIQAGRAAEASAFIEQIIAAHADTAAALYGLGYLARRQNHWERALTYLRRSADLDPQLWEAPWNIGFTFWRTSRYQEARDIYQRLLNWATERGDDERKTRSLGFLGEVSRLLGSYPAALDQFQQALQLSGELGDRLAEERYLANIGAVYYEMGQYAEASIYYQRALTQAQSLGARSDEGRLFGTLAKVYHQVGDFTQAAKFYQRAIAFARETGDQASEVSNLADLGTLSAQLGDCRRALPMFERTLAIVHEIGPKAAEAEHLQDIGYCRQQLGNYPEAVAAYEQALRIAQATSVPQVEANCWNRLGQMHLRLNDKARAVEEHSRALQLGAQINSPHILWEANAGLAAAYEKQERFAEALTHYRQAIEVIESVRGALDVAEERAGFLQDKIEVYKNLIGLLMRWKEKEPTKGYDVMALETSERAHARSLLDLLAEANIDVHQGIGPELKQRERAAQARLSEIHSQLIEAHSQKAPDQRRITTLEEELAKTEDEITLLEREIRRAHPQYADLKYPHPLGLQALESLLDEQTALLEYALGNDGSFLFVVSRNSVRSFRLPREGDIARLVHGIRTVLEKAGQGAPQPRDFRNFVRMARGLYDMLIAPAADILATKRTLVIVPDGALYYLPFECLLTKGATTGTRTLPYLLRQWVISYVPSASVLANLRQRSVGPEPTAAPKVFLAFADPVYELKSRASNLRRQTKGQRHSQSPTREILRSLFSERGRWTLPRLVDSQREVTTIAKLYKAEEVASYFGTAATEEAVKGTPDLKTTRRIHFATHGLISEQQPQYSGLVLTLDDDPAEDGLLQVYEIFNLRLNAELVVLSACRTGLGKEVKGEGVIGLTRAFIYAGAQSLVVSLWRVADRPTADLMVKFYRRMNRDGNKAEALRQAKLEMIQAGGRFAHPLFWAPFILTGEPK